MYDALTVKDLAEVFGKAVKEGHGNKVVLLSDDDEGNGFHTCFYSLLTDPKEVASVMDSASIHDGNDPATIVLLG